MGTAEALRAATTGGSGTGQITAREARNPYDVLAQQLDARLDEFAKLLGGTGQAQAFVRVVRNAVLATPALLEADRGSLLLSAMRAAQDGLLPDGREAVLNIYNSKVRRPDGSDFDWIKKAQYLPMVAGFIKLLWESGEITYIDAAVWYERDLFKFRRGDNASLEHEPFAGAEDPGQIMGAYVVIKMKGGETKREVMYRRDLERVRAVSKAVDHAGNPTGPWKDWYDQQAIKSVIKRVQKQLPRVDRLQRAIAHDNEEMHPQMSVAGQTSMGDLAVVQALAHNPSDTLPPVVGDTRPTEVVARSSAPAPPPPAAQAADAPPDGAGEAFAEFGHVVRTQIDPVDRPDTGSEAAPVRDRPDAGHPEHPLAEERKLPTYAQLAARVNRVRSRDVADLILDEARTCHLPFDQQSDLVRLVDAKFPPRS